MTTWRTPALAGFVEAAGFRGDDRAVAVAVALSASGGNDAYVTEPWGGSLSRYVGLWQVYAAASDTEAIVGLLDPYRNAEAAREAFLANDDRWDWCIGWVTGRFALYLPDARRAVAGRARTDTVTMFGTTET